MDNPRQIRVSREWLQLLEALPTPAGRLVVVGPCDSGKTMLCQWLLSRLRQQGTAAWVDADVGQSQIGPPACVSARLAGTSDYWFSFVGDVTPATDPPTMVAATMRMVRQAEAAGAQAVVVDTTGYLTGLGALALKSAKLDLLAPLHLIALGDNAALRRLLAAWHTDTRVTVHRLPLAETLRQKTTAERTRWRQERFQEYFAACELHELGLHGWSLSGLPTASELEASGRNWQSLAGSLVGFHDRRRLGLALGLVQQLDLRQERMLVRTTPAAERAVGVIFGQLRLDAEGRPLS